MFAQTALDQIIQHLSLSGSPRWVAAGVWLAERAVPQSAEGLALVLGYARAPEPLARYLAGRRLGRFSSLGAERNNAWQALQRLAVDPNRLVREGAAWGLAGFLTDDPESLPLFCEALTNRATPLLLRRAIVLSTLPIIRQGPSDRLGAALKVFETGLGTWQGHGVMIVVGRELAVHHPEQAMALIERWVRYDSSASLQHVARMLGPTLKDYFPERTDLVLKSLTPTTSTMPETSADIRVPARLIDQIIGQDRAVEIIKLAARQRRFVLLVGEPGTGKSLLAAAMAEMMPTSGLEDVLIQPNPESRISPRVERVPAGQGLTLLHDRQAQQQQAMVSFNYLFWLAILATIFVSGFFGLTRNLPWVAVGGAVTVIGLWWARRWLAGKAVHTPLPKVLIANAERKAAPFVDATGFHAGALLGDVRHDPFQSGGFETPPHELVEAGAIHLAHGGVLFIDEASTLSIESQQSLLTAIQERRFPISGRSLGSSGAMVRTEPVPCDFVLVLAGNRDDVAKMHPALRSRMRGYGYEVYLQSTMVNTPENETKLRQFVAQEILKDGRIPPFAWTAIDAIIDEARRRSEKLGHLSARLRDLGGLIRAAGDVAVNAGASLVRPEHVATARGNALTLEEQIETN